MGIEAENVTLESGAEIMSGFTLLKSNATTELKDGASIKSTSNWRCNQQMEAPDQYTCMPQYAEYAAKLREEDLISRVYDQFPAYQAIENLIFENFWGGLYRNYTTYLLSLGDIKMTKSSIEGSRIGVCAANVDLKETTLTTSEHGCPSDYGLGRGSQFGSCAGSGGANGGRGGFGGLIGDSADAHAMFCEDKAPDSYQYGLLPI